MHRCALIGESVKCWGFNGQGQLGDGTTTNRYEPVWVKETNGEIMTGVVKELISGVGGYCTWFEDERLACWGSNESGQSNPGGTVSDLLYATTIDYFNTYRYGKQIKQIALVGSHGCVLFEDNTVEYWGGEDYAQLCRDCGTVTTVTPAPVPGLSGVISSIVAGLRVTCVLINDGTVKCWGRNHVGQLSAGIADASSCISLDGAPTTVNNIDSSGATAVFAKILSLLRRSERLELVVSRSFCLPTCDAPRTVMSATAPAFSRAARSVPRSATPGTISPANGCASWAKSQTPRFVKPVPPRLAGRGWKRWD